MNEARAIELAQVGNEEGFTFLYEAHKSAVLKQCKHIFKNIDAAEDASQDVFLKLYLQISSFRGESKFSSWLYTLTRRVCMDILRAKQRDLPDFSDANMPDLKDDGDDDAQGSITRRIHCRDFSPESRAILNDAFKRQPEQAQVAFNANVMHGLSAARVCRNTGIRSSTRVYADRRRVQAALREAVR